MFERTVLGVDPGVAKAGLAVVGRSAGKPTIVWATTVRTPSSMPDAERLLRVHAAVAEAISEHAVGSVAIEKLLWNRNVGSGMAVARASGVILLAAAQARLEIAEYAPLEVKAAVTGSGSADKAQVRRALERLHGLSDVPTEPDAADAVAVALCHLQQSGLARATARATAGAG